jgi:hypothetical protein
MEETPMARYIVKLVERADFSSSDEHAIQVAVDKRFKEAFEGTSDAWTCRGEPEIRTTIW